jgi:uncharacterized protein (TIGR03790 family)
MSRLWSIALIIAAQCVVPLAVGQDSGASWPNPARLLIIYNSNFADDGDKDGVQDSLEVALYYAGKRGVPSSNLIGLPLSTTGVYSSYSEADTEILRPLRAELSQRNGMIDAILLSYGLPTSYGANGTVTSLDTSITYIAKLVPNQSWAVGNPKSDKNPGFHADLPRFSNADLPFRDRVYMVCRLDGPRGVSGALDLIDQAIYSDRYVTDARGSSYFTGNVYVDSQNSYDDAYLMSQHAVMTGDYSDYASADLNIAAAEHSVLTAPSHLPLKWERSAATIGSAADLVYQDGTSAGVAPRALFYSGWYNYNSYHDVWDWLPGSAVNELSSDSLNLASIRNPRLDLDYPLPTGAFGVRALNAGATCVTGVLTEPYTIGAPMGTTLLHYLLAGYSWAEASLYATPLLPWVNVSIGDPLYSPMRAKPLVPDTTPPALSPGFPQTYQDVLHGRTAIRVQVDDQPEPEVVRVEVDYGLTGAYGQHADSGHGYFRRPVVLLPWLPSGTRFHYRLRLIDPVGNITTTPDFEFVTPTEQPYRGVATQLPGVIQAEEFDEGGAGVAFYASTLGNAGGEYRASDVDIFGGPGGYYAGNVGRGDWMNYTVLVPAEGVFQATASVSGGSGNAFRIEIDGMDVTGALTLPSTSLPPAFQEVGVNGIYLSAGQHVVRVFSNAWSSVAVDWIRFDRDTPPLTVSPSSSSVRTGGSQQLTAALGATGSILNLAAATPTDAGVTWSIAPAVGSISPQGLYQAPAASATPQTITVTAWNRLFNVTATATIIVQPSVQVSVAPGTISTSPGSTVRFTASVSNAADTSVTWSLKSAVGSIDAAGLFKAPASLLQAQTVTVVATSNSDPTVSGTAIVKILPPTTIMVSPRSVVLSSGMSQQFAALLSDASHSGVTWTVTPAVGAIAQTGLYKAPNSIVMAQSITVTATSQADRSKTATAVVNLAP